MIVFDTSFLVGLFNDRDVHHIASRSVEAEFRNGRWGRAVLLEYVFVETVTVLLVRRGLDLAGRGGRSLLRADDIDFIPCSDFFAATFSAFAAQPGTRLSFTDMAVAQFAIQHAEGNLLSFDQEFRKIPQLSVLPLPPTA